MRKTLKTIDIFRKKKNVRTDSESDISSISDNDNILASRLSKRSFDKLHRSSKIKCCLVCSVLPALSNVNCCTKHLTILTKTFPQVSPAYTLYMTSPTNNNCCTRKRRCRPKRSHQSRCSSISNSPSPKKKRLMTSQSSDSMEHDDLLLSPNMERTMSLDSEPQETSSTHQQVRTKNLRIPLSPVFQPSSTINTNMSNNNSRQRNNRLAMPVKTGNTYHKNLVGHKKPTQATIQSTSIDLTASDSNSLQSPRILLKRIIHVKDDDENLTMDTSQPTLNIRQAIQNNIRPRILLQRVSLEQ